ncbi:PA2169 family four-helix-bundle protein [Verrucomicrobiaceae bacterium 227]
MNEKNQTTTDALQDLLTRAYDAEQGFQHAADAVSHVGLAALFREYSDQRRVFGQALKSMLETHGAVPEKGASMMGKLHQFWIDLRGKLSDGREHEILEECLRGEESTMEDYREYLRTSGLEPAAYDLMLNQLAEIETIYKRLEKLEVAAEAMES